MHHSKFHAARGESAVPTLLTLAVSVWFLAAGAAVLADRGESPRLALHAPSLACATPAVVPDTRETITVVAHRG
ncbi:MAG TPA: hypothetical protein VLS49_05685 [Usitatibacter sp.]|nr:hypothetical protein [Usitatibacter sp.]